MSLDRARRHLDAADRALHRADAHLERALASARWLARIGWALVAVWCVVVLAALWSMR